MAQGWRKDRLASEIVRQTGQILIQELRDPRLGFVTVTRVKVSDDYKHAKIFVSVMGSKKQKKLSLSGLKSAQGFVQRELSRRIQMRSFPVIHFELDDSIDKAFKITALMDDIAKKRKASEDAPGKEEE
jgi:ribosome-binding factor A